mgnify:CR=1 FL=1
MNNKKGFANIALVVLVVVVAGALGYVVLFKKPVSTEQLNSQNTQPTLPTMPTNTVSNSEPSITILSPNGGESYKLGDRISVKWSSHDISSETTLQISFVHPGSNVKDVLGYSKNTGSYIWKVDDLPRPLPRELLISVEYNDREIPPQECYGDCKHNVIATDSSDSPFTVTE